MITKENLTLLIEKLREVKPLTARDILIEESGITDDSWLRHCVQYESEGMIWEAWENEMYRTRTLYSSASSSGDMSIQYKVLPSGRFAFFLEYGSSSREYRRLLGVSDILPLLEEIHLDSRGGSGFLDIKVEEPTKDENEWIVSNVAFWEKTIEEE